LQTFASPKRMSGACGEVSGVALWQFVLDAFPVVKANVDGIDAIYLSRDMLDATDLELGPAQQLMLWNGSSGRRESATESVAA
jgi:hypothetical protein